MAILDAQYIQAKRELVESLAALKTALVPLVAASSEGLLADPGGRLAECAAVTDDEAAKLSSGRFRIGIFGLVKAGKSTLINALAEQYVTEVDSLPATTAALHLVRREGQPVVHYLPREGQTRPPRTVALAEAIALLDEKANPDNREGVDYVDIAVDLKYLEPDVVLVDTPGLGYLVRTISGRASRELHESVHAVVLVARVFGGQLWQRDIRTFLAEAVARVPRVFVVINANEARDDEWGPGVFERIRTRFVGELKEASRPLRVALESGALSLHFVAALQAASAVLRLRTLTTTGTDPGGADAATLRAEITSSGFAEFREALGEFASGDGRLWDDLGFRARAAAERIEAARSVVRSTVAPELARHAKATADEITAITDKLTELQTALAGVRTAVEIETQDLLSELVEKTQSQTDAFIDDAVTPAVQRWFATSDTPVALRAELDRLLAAWHPQLQEFLDQRRGLFSKRLALKVRSDLFHRLGVAIDIDPNVPMALADVAQLPSYDLTQTFERGLSAAGVWLAAGLCGAATAALCGPETAGQIVGGFLGAGVVLGVGFGVVREMTAASLRRQLVHRAIPAMVKGFFKESAVRQLATTKADMRRFVRDNFARRKQAIADQVAATVGAALAVHQDRLTTEWTARKSQLTARLVRLGELTKALEAFGSAAEVALTAATKARK